MNRLLRGAMATALVALVVGALATADAAPRAQSSASVLSLVKKYAKKYAKQYAKRGPRGLRGPQGPAGVTTTDEVLGPEVATGPSGSGNSVQSSAADCPDGTLVTGGGHHGGVRTFIADSYKSGNGWFVIAVNNGSLTESIQAQAVCARGPGTSGGLKRSAKPSGSVAAARAERLAEVRAQAGQK